MPTVYPRRNSGNYQTIPNAYEAMGKGMVLPPVPEKIMPGAGGPFGRGVNPIIPAQAPNPYQDTLRQYGQSNEPPSVAIKQRLELERQRAIAERNQLMKSIDAKQPEEHRQIRLYGTPEQKELYKEYELWKKQQQDLQTSVDPSSFTPDPNSAYGPPLFESDAYAPLLAAAGDRGSMHPNSQPNITTYSGIKRG